MYDVLLAKSDILVAMVSVVISAVAGVTASVVVFSMVVSMERDDAVEFCIIVVAGLRAVVTIGLEMSTTSLMSPLVG